MIPPAYAAFGHRCHFQLLRKRAVYVPLRAWSLQREHRSSCMIMHVDFCITSLQVHNIDGGIANVISFIEVGMAYADAHSSLKSGKVARMITLFHCLDKARVGPTDLCLYTCMFYMGDHLHPGLSCTGSNCQKAQRQPLRGSANYSSSSPLLFCIVTGAPP